MRRTVGNFSALAMMAKEHHKIVYYRRMGLAMLPARGSTPNDEHAGQPGSSDHLDQSVCLDCVMATVETASHTEVDRRACKHVYLWMRCLFLFSAARTFEHAKGLATTLQRDRLHQYMFEDHSVATFRVRKALVPESVLFATTPDVNKDHVATIYLHMCECFQDLKDSMVIEFASPC